MCVGMFFVLLFMFVDLLSVVPGLRLPVDDEVLGGLHCALVEVEVVLPICRHLQGNLQKWFGRCRLSCCHTIYIIYLSLCTQPAETTSPKGTQILDHFDTIIRYATLLKSGDNYSILHKLEDKRMTAYGH